MIDKILTKHSGNEHKKYGDNSEHVAVSFSVAPSSRCHPRTRPNATEIETKYTTNIFCLKQRNSFM
jgi:hypothetical protein